MSQKFNKLLASESLKLVGLPGVKIFLDVVRDRLSSQVDHVFDDPLMVPRWIGCQEMSPVPSFNY